MASSPITSWQIDGETMKTVTDFISLSSKITADGDCSHEIKRHLFLGRKAMTNLDSILKRRAITWPTKVCKVTAVVFPIVMYGCESWTIKKGWMPKKWCLWTVVLEKTLERTLGSKEIKPVNSKGNQPWILIGRTDSEAKAPILWPPDVKSRLTGKDPDTGKDWGQEKGVVEDKMVGWHPQPQWSWVWANSGRWWRAGSLLCCSPWGHRVGHDWVNEQQQDQMPLADICRAFCPKAAEYIFFSRVYVTFSRVDHMLGHTLRFSKFKKIEKPLAWLIKKKREIAQISKIRNEKGEVTMDTTEIQRIIQDYYKQLCATICLY